MSKENIFTLLGHIDNKHYQHFSKLSTGDKQKTSLYMALKWMSGTNDAKKILLLNATANKWLFELSAYPELVYHILTVCGSGKPEFYKWLKKESVKISRPLTVDLLQQYYNISKADAIEDSLLMDISGIMFIADELGCNNIGDKLKKEYS